ncbi:MAG: adenosylcobinamide-GDP ribazoletransferase [Thermodesulfovibrionales bacterium]|nr:adenosylcobinamide-GDP ribazoletransferase [Thermodesulfovibrionales bacterium]
MIKNFMIALQFLTILPIKIDSYYNEKEIAKSSSAFIFVGFFQGFLLLLLNYALNLIFHEELVIALLLLFLVLLNGGFHLDGLSDTFDALSVKSTGDDNRDRQKRLTVMKDSTAGPIGIMAIVFTLALKYLSLKGISHMPYFIHYSTLFLMPVVPKWTMVTAMFYGKPAKDEGLGKIFLEGVGNREFLITTIIFIITLMGLYFLFISFAPKPQYLFNIVIVVIMYIFCRWWIAFCDKRFGGLTGDNLGALSEMTEVLFLILVIIWSRLYI